MSLFSTSDADKSVLSAMSGGVDSSVATLRLLEDGYDVAGVTMALFDGSLVSPVPIPEAWEISSSGVSKSCEAIAEDIPSAEAADARAVCERLGIPHLTVDLMDRFRSDVVERFCDAYLAGDTPNPCIECNRHLKLAALQQKRRDLGAQYVATGHYVRRGRDPQTGAWQLLRAKDAHKDQSYVLYRLTQDDLAHMLFPLGELTKEEVRAAARQHGFANADKQESQDICFIPDGDYTSFIRRFKGADSAPLFEPGDIVDLSGKRLGQHAGLIHYTIGQRRGIGIASPEPLYVAAKDVAANELIVAPREDLSVREISMRDVNAISGDLRDVGGRVEVKTGYRQQPVPAELEVTFGGTVRILFDEPPVRPATGQSAVAYKGDAVVCGGIICG